MLRFVNTANKTLVATLLLVTLRVQSQEAAPATDADLAEVPADGFVAGTFQLQPDLSVGIVHDTNIFATRTDEIDDEILIITPSLHLESLWQKHSYNLSAGAQLGRYNNQTDEDYDDYWLDMDGQFDYNPTGYLFAGAGISRDHEDRGSPDAIISGSEPTVYESAHGHLGISHSFGDYNIRFGGTLEQLEYQNSGALNNQDRDRSLAGLGLRGSWKMDKQYAFYLQGIGDSREYADTPDDFGRNRDSDGYRVHAGLQARPSNRTQVTAYLGWLEQNYKADQFRDVSTADYGLSAFTTPVPGVDLSFSLSRSLEETTSPLSPGYLYTSFQARLNHRLNRRLSIFATAAVAESDFQQTEREDYNYGASFGVSYDLSEHYYLAAQYRFDSRDSNVEQEVLNPASVQATEDFSRNQFTLNVGARLYPVQSWPKPSKGVADNTTQANISGDARRGWAGFYTGAAVGLESMTLETSSVRGETGLDQGEFADAAATGSVYLGYGWALNNWYLGLEIDGVFSDSTLTHAKTSAKSRAFSLERDGYLGAFLRLGYQLQSGSLVYARAGLVENDFKLKYSLNDEPENELQDRLGVDGQSYGVGMQLPLSSEIFLGVDYRISTLGDYTADLVTETDSMEFGANHFQIGLGWVPGGDLQRNSVAEYQGGRFYGGLQMAHHTLFTDIYGTHADNGAVSDFNGEFGGTDGFAGGVFIGYDYIFSSRWVFGLELNLEDSNASWQHERSPGGRNFSVERKDSIGAGIKIGYQLHGGSTLYLVGSRVQTRFNTLWTKGSNSDNYVDRDDRQNGSRLGLGVETTMGSKMFWRMEYAYTDYGNYQFTTSHNQADSLEFSNQESVFRVGVGVRF
jgi:hypothetical protein